MEKQTLIRKRDSLLNLLRSEVGGSTMDLIDELLDAEKAKDETRRMNIMNSLVYDLSGSEQDLVDELVEVDALINPA